MSASLVHKSLSIVDPELNIQAGKKKHKKIKSVLDLIPEKHKATKKVGGNNKKAQKVSLLSTSHKLNILEARKKIKPKEEIVKENLRKLKVVRKVCSVDLNKEIASQIIERAVTKRPIKIKHKTKKKEEKSVFTEEDFKKFEEEYLGS